MRGKWEKRFVVSSWSAAMPHFYTHKQIVERSKERTQKALSIQTRSRGDNPVPAPAPACTALLLWASIHIVYERRMYGNLCEVSKKKNGLGT